MKRHAASLRCDARLRRPRGHAHPAPARPRCWRRRRAASSSITLRDDAVDVAEADAARRGRLRTATSLAALSRAGAVPPARRASKASARQGKRAKSGCSNCSAAIAVRSSCATPEVDALRVGQRVGDRRAHVRIAQLRQHRAVDVRHHRMDHALRVDHAPRSGRPARRTASAPRSLPGPCSSWWPNRPKSCGP